MNLAIDIGNTSAKLALIERGQVVDFFRTDTLDRGYAAALLDANPGIEAVIVASSGLFDERLESMFRERVGRFIRFDHTVPVPLCNRYATPETLGADRLAAAVGANTLYPGCNILVVDFGTAITFDFISAANEFLGGNISPGAAMRFRALHEFTRNLPLGAMPAEPRFLGDSSVHAVEYGVVNGIVYEIEGYIRDLTAEYADLRIIFTGGDAIFFAKRLKNAIFATDDLVAYGLNRILEYNSGRTGVPSLPDNNGVIGSAESCRDR